MRRVRVGLLAAVGAIGLLTAGCGGNGGGTAAGRPAATAASPGGTAAPSSAAPSAAATTTAVPGLPDGYDASRDAAADVTAAIARAAKQHKEVLLDFGANWCPDCRALDTMFRSARVEPLLAKDYVVVAVDVGQFNHNLDLAGRYVHLESSGIPALVVLSSGGSLVTATNDGAFSDARAMRPDQVASFLETWARGAGA